MEEVLSNITFIGQLGDNLYEFIRRIKNKLEISVPVKVISPISLYQMVLDGKQKEESPLNFLELRQKFFEKFGDGQVNGFFAPGRVNLIGEHTDYNGGFVFPCALSFGIYCLIRKTKRKSVRMVSVNMSYEADISVDNLNKPVGKEWVNYPVGVFAQFLKKGLIFEYGVDILFFGDIPTGAGLSSSAALEVVTAGALKEIYRFQ